MTKAIKLINICKIKILLSITYIIPVFLILGFINTFSINVPIGDEWALLHTFDSVSTGQATFKEFFAQHNEHRIMFPRLIFVGLAFISKWNIIYELCFSAFLVVITFILIFIISSKQIDSKSNCYLHLANISTSLLLFSWVQHENWLSGFQAAWFLINACVSSAIFTLNLSNQYFSKAKIYLASVFCFIASFSLAQGLLSWLAIIPLIASLKGNSRQKKIRITIWIILFVLTAFIYSVGYIKPPHDPNYDPSLFFFFLSKQPLAVLNYYLTLLGSSLLRSLIFSPVVGFLVLSIFLFLATRYWQSLKPLSFKEKAAPWISLGFFALLAALFTTIGRVGLGVEQAMVSRYTTHSMLLLVAITQLLRLFVLDKYSQQNLAIKPLYKPRVIYGCWAGIMTVFFITNSFAAVEAVKPEKVSRQQGKICLELINYIDEQPSKSCLSPIFPDRAFLEGSIPILEKLGFRKIARDISFVENPLKDYGYIDSPQTTGASIIKKSCLNCVDITVAGWAILPDQKYLPEMVLLSYGDRRSFFAIAPVNLSSPDIAKALKSPQYQQVRWSVNFSPDLFPLGETEIKAWVYNPYENQFVRLKGKTQVTVEE